MTVEEEKELISRIKQNPSLFGTLFDLHYQAIFTYLLRRTADYDLARDVTSETFLKAYLNIGEFEPRGIPISFWFYRIASNELRSHYRRFRFLPVLLSNLREFSLQVPQTTDFRDEKDAFEKELADHEDYLTILEVMKRLSPQYQEVLALRFFEQKPLADIARILGKPEGTVKSLLSRGIAKIRKLIGEPSQQRKENV